MATTTTMLYRQLSIDWEPLWGNGKLDFASGLEAVAQAIVTSLKLYTNEWFANINDGIPMVTSILGKTNKEQAAIERIITARILGVKNVTGVTRVASSYNASTRQYSYECVVDTVFGSVAVTSGG
jgi:hypothetical protein